MRGIPPENSPAGAFLRAHREVFILRASGILLPVSSLPSPYGIGTLGRSAYEFVDFLQEAGQAYWQVLPIGPTSYGDSPYQSFSTFAGNPYFLDLDIFCDQGLLTKEECLEDHWGDDPEQVDYKALWDARFVLFRKAFARGKEESAMKKFREENRWWLEDYALYMAVKAQMEDRSWITWDEDIRLRRPEALARYREELWEDVDFYIFLQYHFYEQWGALRKYANQKGVKLIGDIPIYVALDSADVWAEPEQFQLDEDCRPIDVAGCPPDAFSADGQLWGNPLYRWEDMKENQYAWWVRRLRHNVQLFDMTRIDHFRGFAGYYAIPYGDKTAKNGEWRKGPGIDFFRSVKKQLGKMDLIAEDLGFLTPDVKKMLKASGYPGMKVLQFAFDSREESDYLPHNYDKNCVVYTGTHDNDTTAGWFETAPKADVRFAKKYLGVRYNRDGAWAFIRAAMASVANLAVTPMQDFLNLGSEARMNTPSTLGGNWMWRMQEGAASPELAAKIRDVTKLYGRVPASRKAKP